MDIIIKVVLPLGLAFIMFSLGLGLTMVDFKRVAKLPKAFFIGFLAQVVLLPLVAYLLLQLVSLPGELALGLMLLSFCPGGVTSNIMTRLAGGALALSITLTAVFSLLAVVTVPFLVLWAAQQFAPELAKSVNVTALGITMFALTAVPVALGLLVRRFATDFAIRVEPWVVRAATALFILIVVAAIAGNLDLLLSNLATFGPLVIALNVVMIAIGYLLSRLAGLNEAETAAISIETGVQNSTLGIALGSLIVGGTAGLPALSLASGVYGVMMYFVTLPFVFWMRSRLRR